MDLEYGPEYGRLREEVERFLAELPADLDRRSFLEAPSRSASEDPSSPSTRSSKRSSPSASTRRPSSGASARRAPA